MKRKVTDLLPNEAILISNDAERDAILQLMEDAGMRWNGNESAFRYIPDVNYDYCLTYKSHGNQGIVVLHKNNGKYQGFITYPATDFIGSEFSSSGLTVSERDLLVDYHNFIFDDPRVKECDVVGECVELFLLTRNTPTDERID
jgi:hypothetical protein